MATETEHKYLVHHELWQKVQPRKGEHIRQGYLQNEPDQTVRVRLKGKRGYITVKGKTTGASRPEYEFRIPLKGAIEMLDKLCREVIEKTRYKMRFRGRTWEVDVFEGPNEGLIVAEIELQNEDQQYYLPKWVSENVTGDERYYNSSLVVRPFKRWVS
jgi:adenylate cyclase